MHSDIAIEIAYSGEFFIRPLRHRRRATDDPAPTEPEPGQHTHTNDSEDEPQSSSNEFDEDNPPDDPALYELVIDSGSGTYRGPIDAQCMLVYLYAFLYEPQNGAGSDFHGTRGRLSRGGCRTAAGGSVGSAA